MKRRGFLWTLFGAPAAAVASAALPKAAEAAEKISNVIPFKPKPTAESFAREEIETCCSAVVTVSFDDLKDYHRSIVVPKKQIGR